MEYKVSRDEQLGEKELEQRAYGCGETGSRAHFCAAPRPVCAQLSMPQGSTLPWDTGASPAPPLLRAHLDERSPSDYVADSNQSPTKSREASIKLSGEEAKVSP